MPEPVNASDAMNAPELRKRLLIFGALLGWCAVLLLGRFVRAQSFELAFMAWNLVLAAIPAIAAGFFARAAEKRAHVAIHAMWFALWLAFLPNAPYLLTDFQHLNHSPGIPRWYDIALFSACAGTGLLLGYTSLADVQAVISRRFSIRLGWVLAGAALFLSGFGIYLGRFLRWNSWDVLTKPVKITFDTARWLSNPQPLAEATGMTLIYGTTLLLGYIALRTLQPGIGRAK